MERSATTPAKIAAIANLIINSAGLDEHLAAAKKLSQFYKELADDISMHFSVDNETGVKGGVALSTLHASHCTDDYLRTVYFIKGVYRAINKLLETKPVITIIYAGCGPFATLLVPVLPLINKEKIEAIFIDINKDSIDAVASLLDTLDLNSYNITLSVADATTYQKPETCSIDMLITETMHYALTSEPQVAVTKNFIPQLQKHSVIIPRQIDISMGYSFFAKEAFLKDPEQLLTGNGLTAYPHRTQTKNLFSINKNFLDILSTEYQIISPVFYKPEDFELHPDICIFTEVQVFEDIVISIAQSLITNPYCITSLYNLKTHSGFQLVYDFSETPKWACLYY